MVLFIDHAPINFETHNQNNEVVTIKKEVCNLHNRC